MGPGAFGPEGLTGQTVAGYRLDTLLGMGATGAVFLGTRLPETANIVERTGEVPTELPEQAAIKLLILPWQLSPEERDSFRSRFVREAQTLQRLRHPHILSVLSYGEDPATGFTYMILPYMSGGTLASKIASAGTGLPLDEVTKYLTQVATALDAAHSQGVIHRDIKPGNVLLDGAGQAYLADFSIVRLVADAHTKLTTTGRVMGTPSYMAPEQISGAGTIGPACDIYSLGMVVYEMVTGRVAFDSGTLMELIRQHVQDEPPAPRQLRPDLPPPAEAAILRALAKNPTERFATAAEFTQAFTDGLRGRWAAGLTAYIPGARHTQVDAHNATTVGADQRAPLPAQRRRRSGAGVLMTATVLMLVCSLLFVGLTGTGFSTLQNAFALWGIPGFGQTPTPALAQASASVTTTHGAGHVTATPKPNNGGGGSGNGGGGGGGGGGGSNPAPTPTWTPSPTPTFTPTPLPTFVISADGTQSSDGVAHGPGNPYIFTGSGPYGNVLIQSGAYVTAVSHCGAGGSGTVQFTANGTVTIAGTITVDADGYCGGREPTGASGGYQGESYAGSSQQQTGPNYGGGGGGAGADSGGAGGSYGTQGQAAVNGSDIPPTYPGTVYGDSTIATLYLGSGGGSSGAQSTCIGGAGGNGGGAISIVAQSIIVTSTGRLSANGGNGESRRQGTGSDYRGGGGGSGGSIYLQAPSISISGTVVASGGQGGYGIRSNNSGPASGGIGGDGRIRFAHS